MAASSHHHRMQTGDQMETDDSEQQRFEFKCDEINKRSMGKAILKFCGNEGTQDNDNKSNLRRLLQAVISHIPNENTSVWLNAEVKIFDDECDVYIIQSGKGTVKFQATFDGYGNPKVVKVKQGQSDCCIVI